MLDVCYCQVHIFNHLAQQLTIVITAYKTINDYTTMLILCLACRRYLCYDAHQARTASEIFDIIVVNSQSVIDAYNDIDNFSKAEFPLWVSSFLKDIELCL
jgi:hypothetical protein